MKWEEEHCRNLEKPVALGKGLLDCMCGNGEKNTHCQNLSLERKSQWLGAAGYPYKPVPTRHGTLNSFGSRITSKKLSFSWAQGSSCPILSPSPFIVRDLRHGGITLLDSSELKSVSHHQSFQL